MAEAFLRKYAGDYFEVFSAGLDPKPINPYIIKVMQEADYDLSKQYSKELWKLVKEVYFSIVITVCNRKEEEDCPTIPGPSTRLYWDVADSSAFEGIEEEKIAKFRDVRDQINEKVKSWLKERKIME